jgi:Periplasmic protein involved in polysaccharide export
MHKQILRIAAILLILLSMISIEPILAQRSVTNTNVQELSNDQIQRVIDEMQKQNLSQEQAIQLARARGVSQQQIDQLIIRIRELELAKRSQVQTEAGTATVQTINKEDTLSVKMAVNTSTINSKIFGFHLFNEHNLTFEPSVNISVPSDYVVGIGDEIVIQVWGASQQTYILSVDKNGDIVVLDIGPIKVAGMNFEAMKSLVLRRLPAIYSDMTNENPSTFASVTVNNIRSIKVNVIGDVLAPGTYTLPATSSAFNALYLSGGPNENGSFREIKIIRDNKTYAIVDVYDYLINGNTLSNISLRDQDILYIPPYNKRVETTGAFKRNAIFELKEGESLTDLLRYSGGFREQASKSRLLLTRFTNNEYELTEVDAEDFNSALLRNGDLIEAEGIIDRYENRLTIEGAVFRPGTYALEKGMTLSMLIEKAGGLREDYYPNRGLIIRLDSQLYPTVIPFNLSEVISGGQNPLLQREDHIIIQDIFGIGEKKTLRIYGEVMNPGEYDFHKNMTLKDIIFVSGGMKESASESYIEVARRNSYEESQQISSKMVSLYTFSIDRNLQLNESDNAFILAPFDQIYIRQAPSYVVQQTVIIQGEVKYPGPYSISHKNERVSDLLKRAGGLTPEAFPEGARLRRVLDRQMKQQFRKVETVADNLDSANVVLATEQNNYLIMELRLPEILKDSNSTDNYLLKEGDEIFIPMKAEEIIVNGEVLNPAGLAWQPGKNITYYVDRAGGFSPNAKRNKVYIIYSNGTTAITKNFIFRNYPEIKPGCQIIVPARPERQKTETSTWLAIGSTFASIALALSAILK